MQRSGSLLTINGSVFWTRALIFLQTFLVVLFLEVAGQDVPETKHKEQKKSFRNYKVLRTIPIQDEKTLTALMMLDGLEDILFWKYPAKNVSADIMTSPEKLNILESMLNKMDLSYTTIIEDVEKLFEEQNDTIFTEKQANLMSWNRYHRYNVIMNYAKQQATRDEMVSYESIGTSSEGREIGLVKVSSGQENMPAIFIDGGMHAREWISPATVTYMMHKLITDDNFRDLVEKFDWYFVPIVNVDGYEYTHTTNRMWRKTRSRNYGSHCIGTDPNRNWAFQWGGLGTSGDPCSDIYRGSRAFSEPETSAVAAAILQRRNQIKLYLTFHSYSQLWLIPWSHKNEKPADYNELFRMAKTGAKGLTATFGTRYKVGSAPDLLYEAAGGSDDWAKGSAGIKYSYTVELRDTGVYGFALPASQIQATGEETLRGVAAIARSLHKTINDANV